MTAGAVLHGAMEAAAGSVMFLRSALGPALLALCFFVQAAEPSLPSIPFGLLAPPPDD